MVRQSRALIYLLNKKSCFFSYHIQSYSVILCASFDTGGFRGSQVMVFAIDEINRNPSLLPNVTLGYSLYDTCLTLGVALPAVMSMISGREEQFTLEESCVGTPPPVLGIVGPSTSKSSIAISRILGLYRVPAVSFLLETPFTMAHCL